MNNFLIINGPNLNMLGTREPEKYGSLTLGEIQKYTEEQLKDQSVSLEWFQSNDETAIIERIHQATSESWKALIINPAAYSHTSVAILDALKILTAPIIEVHLTNTNSREDFRQKKITAQASSVTLEGLGKNAYYFAVLSQLV
jgi:3-dehydroquinate dehydratase-2